LKTLFLKDTNLIYFDFLINFDFLKFLDISDNLEYYNSDAIEYSYPLLYLQISNTSTSNLKISFSSKSHIDISHNNLEFINDNFEASLIYLDMSYNQFRFFLTHDIEVRYFLDKCRFLNYINIAQSLTRSISNKIIFFSKFLEVGIFSSNFLNSFSKFCQPCPYQYDCSEVLPSIDFKCRLRVLLFDSNDIKSILYTDLNELENLEILNLDNNQIDFIEKNSFSKLIKLETLILSRNSLKSDLIDLFDELKSLKFLNLSSNSIEYVSRYLFNQLQKLETLDLSYNRIQLLESFSFFKLISLKLLHLNDNSNVLQIHNETFIQLESIQNIHISNSILNEQTRGKFPDLFKYKNGLETKIVLKRHLYKSLFILSKYTNYDCDLTLFFIRNNVHYNFKSETEIYDYFSECSQMRIKNVYQNSNISSFDRNSRIFTNIIFYFFNFTLMFIVFLAIVCLFVVLEEKRINDEKVVNLKKTNFAIQNKVSQAVLNVKRVNKFMK
jgi:Leucine-rich repeat (LRR) protein